MFCKLTCGIAIMFIIATIWMNLSMRDKSSYETTYLKLLDNRQKDLYNKIKIEELTLLCLDMEQVSYYLSCLSY